MYFKTQEMLDRYKIRDWKYLLLRGRETIAEHRQISKYTSQSGENFIQTTSIKTGKTGDALWSEIIDKSMHGRERVDELFKLDGL